MSFNFSKYSDTVTEIHFNDAMGFTVTGFNGAFYNFPKLNKIILPTAATSISNACGDCQNLIQAQMAGSSSNITYARQAFMNCTSLKGTPLRLDKAIDIYGIYKNCRNITGEAFIGDNVTDASYAYHNSGINSVNFSLGEDRGSIDLTEAFSNCHFDSLFLNFFTAEYKNNISGYDTMLKGATCNTSGNFGSIIARADSPLGIYLNSCYTDGKQTLSSLNNIPGFALPNNVYYASAVEIDCTISNNLNIPFPSHMKIYLITPEWH